MSRANDPAYDSEDYRETSEGEAVPCAKCGQLPHYTVTSNPGWKHHYVDVYCSNGNCENSRNVVDGCDLVVAVALAKWDDEMDEQREEANSE